MASGDAQSVLGSESPQLHHLLRLFRAQRTAADHQPPPTITQRRRMLFRLRQVLLARSDELCAAVSADFGGRSSHETMIFELFPSIESIRHARRQSPKWARPRWRPVSMWYQPAASRVEFQPLGVVGIVAPFNYPLYLSLGPLAGALAAGNRVMLKLSEYTPATGAALKSVLAEVFEEGQVAVVLGDADVARAFTSLPFDHLFFTGSPAVGRQVMQSAAANLTPVTLELGGKSPVIVDRSAEWERTVRQIMVGKTMNAGQTCVAPDYVLVPQGQAERFAISAERHLSSLYPSLWGNPDYSSIINERHYRRLEEMLADAAAKGAEVLTYSPDDGPPSPAIRKLPPALVLQTTPEMRICQEEVFGPLLPVLTYDNLDEAIAYVNNGPRPLALYCFSRDRRAVRRVLDRTCSGTAAINSTVIHAGLNDLPFGGVGLSGFGRYHGREGFETFSNIRGIMYKPRPGRHSPLDPPYGRRAEALLKLMLRRPSALV